MNNNAQDKDLFSAVLDALTKLAEDDTLDNSNKDTNEDDNKENTVSEDKEKEDDSGSSSEDKPKTKEEIRESLEKALDGSVNTAIDSIIKCYMILYGSGFSGMPCDGVVSRAVKDTPVMKVGSDGKTIQGKTDLVMAFKLIENIDNNLESINNIVSKASKSENTPDLKLLARRPNSYCVHLQLAFMSANIEYAHGMISIRKWITSLNEDKSISADDWFIKWTNKNNSGNRTRLVSISNIKKWYSWALRNIIYNAVMECGYTEVNGETLDSIITVIKNVSGALKNAVVIKKYVPNTVLNIDVSSCENYDASQLHKSINQMTQGILSVKTDIIPSTDSSIREITSLSVILDAQKALNDKKFAGEVLDGILESEQKPSWENALLGESVSGQPVFWDRFANPSCEDALSRAYTIYASSGSGKGTMTSAILSNALCSGVHVFYTDGKPENGAALGLMAWKNGKEAYVFDGQPSGSEPFSGELERYTHDLRNPVAKIQFLKQLPSMFTTSTYMSEQDQRVFFGLMRYLKSLVLMSEIVENRQANKIDSSVWDVWVFDEMTSMCKHEKEIREKFINYISKVYGKTPGLDLEGISKIKDYKEIIDPDSPKKDDNLIYIEAWREWLKKALSNISKLRTISLRKARTDLFFIFQNAAWLKENKEMFICKVAKEIGVGSTKIIGKGGASKDCGEYSDSSTLDQNWYKNFVGNGYWAISKRAELNKNAGDDSVIIFKPFNIYTVPLKDGKMMPPSEVEALSDEDKRKYFEGYMKILADKFNLDIPATLQSAFDYANDAVQTLNLYKERGLTNSNLLDYMYDCTKLSISSMDVSYENLVRSMQQSGGIPDGVSDPERTTDNPSESDNHGTKESEESGMYTGDNGVNDDIIDPDTVDETLKYIFDAKPSWGVAINSLSEDNKKVMYKAKDTTEVYDIVQKLVSVAVQYKCESAMRAAANSVTSPNVQSILQDESKKRSFISSVCEKFKGDVAEVRTPLDFKTFIKKNLQVWVRDVLELEGNGYGTSNQEYEQQNTYTGTDDKDLYGTLNNNINFGNVVNSDEESIYQDENGRYIFKDIDDSLEVDNIDSGDLVEPCIDPENKIFKAKKKLFESMSGTSYVCKMYWDAVLDGICAKFSNDIAMVKSIGIVNEQVIINGKKKVDMSTILGGEYELEASDIIDIDALLARFKFLNSLVLDANAICTLMYRHDDLNTAVADFFNINKRLKVVALVHRNCQFNKYSHLLVRLPSEADKRDPAVITREKVYNEIEKQNIRAHSVKIQRQEAARTKLDLIGMFKRTARGGGIQTPGRFMRAGGFLQRKGFSAIRSGFENLGSDNPEVGRLLLQGAGGALAVTAGTAINFGIGVLGAGINAIKGLCDEFKE